MTLTWPLASAVLTTFVFEEDERAQQRKRSLSSQTALAATRLRTPGLSLSQVPEDFCPAQMTITCSGSYTLTQKNVDATYISNTATVTALPPAAGDQCAISANDSATVWWALHPGLLVGESKDGLGI